MQVLFCDDYMAKKGGAADCGGKLYKAEHEPCSGYINPCKIGYIYPLFPGIQPEEDYWFLNYSLAHPQYCLMLMCEQEENCMKDRNT